MSSRLLEEMRGRRAWISLWMWENPTPKPWKTTPQAELSHKCREQDDAGFWDNSTLCAHGDLDQGGRRRIIPKTAFPALGISTSTTNPRNLHQQHPPFNEHPLEFCLELLGRSVAIVAFGNLRLLGFSIARVFPSFGGSFLLGISQETPGTNGKHT